MFVHGYSAARQGPAQVASFQLPTAIGKADGVVAGHHALMLQREDQVQILPSDRNKSSSTLTGFYTELEIEHLDVFRPEKLISRFHRGHLSQPQFLRQPSLPGAKATFATPPSLGRISRN